MGLDKPALDQKPDLTKSAIRWLMQSLAFTLIFGLCLFLSSDQWDWGMAWAYLGLFILSQVIVGIFLVPKNPELVAERTELKASPDAQWDRPLVGTVSIFGPAAILVVAGLDQRWGWTSHVPESIQISALGIIILGSLLTIWAMVSNRFFYGHVRIEEGRGHVVANTGPYQSVRHPGYAGAILFHMATPLLLDSLWAFIPAGVVIIVLIVRTALEDRMLMNELDGYQAYARQVRHRLLPGIW
jgi:protein-S-isoprenylcysteine O-methyltransferase Ste14